MALLQPYLLVISVSLLCLVNPANAEAIYVLPDGSEVRRLEAFQECDICPEMIVLPPGTHLFGSSEQARQDAVARSLAIRRISPDSQEASFWDTYTSELPEHPVAMDLPIAIARHEVTRRDWAACVAAERCFGDFDIRIRQFLLNGPYQDDPRSPIIGVTFLEMLDYVGWINDRVGADVYRLPTEVEWEYAARAGVDTIYGLGDTVSRDQANFLVGWREGDPLEWVYDPANERMPISVDRLDAANAWGLRHMTGNVAEVTLSCYSDRHLGFDSAGRYLASTVRPLGCKRVLKGGAHRTFIDMSRPERRIGIHEDSWNSWVGFRLVRELATAPDPLN